MNKDKSRDTRIFWGELAPCEHIVQIYENDEIFMRSLENFVHEGLKQGEGIILIATVAHLEALEKRLSTHGFNTAKLIGDHQLITFDAEAAISEFVVNGWPDEDLFRVFISSLLAKARRNPGRIRAFGEIVALLWARGLNGATVRLEHLWNQFCETEGFSLFCAYPKTGFTEDAHASLQTICGVHARVIGEDV